MGLMNRASLIVVMAFVVVATYSLMEVSGSGDGQGNYNSTQGGGWGWGWGGPGFNHSGGWGGPGFNHSGGWGGPGFNHSGGWGGPGFNHSGGWGGPGFNHSGGGDWPTTHRKGPNKIIVGGSQQLWNFGFNYSDWAMKNGPFYLNDVLVFKYDPPLNGSHPHSVYLLPDWKSYQNCDLRKAKRLASPTQGSGKGFEYGLKKWQPYYFACVESNGFHCSAGMMKFFAVPVFHWTR